MPEPMTDLQRAYWLASAKGRTYTALNLLRQAQQELRLATELDATVQQEIDATTIQSGLNVIAVRLDAIVKRWQ